MPEAKAVGFSSSKPARLVLSGLGFKGFSPFFLFCVLFYVLSFREDKVSLFYLGLVKIIMMNVLKA